MRVGLTFVFVAMSIVSVAHAQPIEVVEMPGLGADEGPRIGEQESQPPEPSAAELTESSEAGSLCCLYVLFGGLLLTALITRHRRRSAIEHGARGWANVDISALQLGIDGRARRELEPRLAALAKASSDAELAKALAEAIDLLSRARLSWLYSAVTNFKPMSAASAQGIFAQLVGDARSRAGDVREEKTEEGIAVVTLIVAARVEIADKDSVAQASQIEALLESLLRCATPEAIVGAEIVWSPAAGHMSTAEREARYRRLSQIDEASIAGRVFCRDCRWPFAAEIGACPQCGTEVERA